MVARSGPRQGAPDREQVGRGPEGPAL